MQQGGAEFLDLLNNKKKERDTCLLVLLHGDGEVVRELGPAEQWCSSPEQTWNRCYTARYRADGKGALVAPLIRQLCDEISGRAAGRPLVSAATKNAAAAPDWSRLEQALAVLGQKWTEMSDQQVIENFGSVLQSVLVKGERLVLFCEVDEGPGGQTEERFEHLGLGRDEVSRLQEWLPERFALVLAGIPERDGPRAIEERIVRLRLGPDYFEATPPEDRSQPLASDRPRGNDTLNIESEVNALADAIAARDMKPPFVLGVLGGWGAGKSFVLHLLEKRLLGLREKNILDPAVRASFPYVGHFYMVWFDAWTYAKADLWSSLMHKMLLALNDQIAFEQLSAHSYRDIIKRRAEEECEDDESAEKETKRLRLLRKADELVAADGTFDEKSEAEFREFLASKAPSFEVGTLASWYHSEKRSLFDRKFATLLSGADNFTPLVVEKLRASKGDTQDALGKLENDVLWSRLQGLNARLREELGTRRAELRKEKSRLADQEATLGEEADAELRVRRWETWSLKMADVLGASFRQAVDKRLEQARKGAGTAAGGVVPDVPFEEAIASLGSFRMAIAGRSLRTLAILGFFLLGGVIVALAAQQLAREWVALTSVAGGVLAGGIESWRRANAWMRTQVERFDAFDEAVRTEQQARREALTEEKMSADATYQKQAKDVADLEAEVESLTRKVGLTAGHETLLDFIAHRLQEEGGYVERLGLLHQVQTDIHELTEGLISDSLCVRNREAETAEEAKLNLEQGRDLELCGVDLEKVLFPRGAPRVVLFIDDLDRCPPSRVVEVLEAAQLLVKTELFVVVIAMDVRYITKALEKAYEGVLDRRGAPSGLDYIEKIIQVPYRIRPISAEAMPGYLRSQTLRMREPAPPPPPEDPEDDPGQTVPVSKIFPPSETRARIDETVPPKVIAFEDDELELIETCAVDANITPRATKRLLNVMKLIKIIWYRSGEDSVPLEIKKTTVFFLTMSACYAEIMRRVLIELERVVADPSHPDYRTPIAQVIEKIADDWESVEGRRIEWKGLRRAAGKTALLPAGISIEQLGTRNVELIRSVSFVGEVDLPRDPGVQQVSLELRDPVRIAPDHSPSA